MYSSAVGNILLDDKKIIGNNPNVCASDGGSVILWEK